MCGIVGLLVKTPALREQLGSCPPRLEFLSGAVGGNFSHPPQAR
jgi:hypothetical protein